MAHAGREKTAVARAEFARLSAYFGQRAALEQVADLLDSGMPVRQRAFALLDHAQHYLDPRCAHGLGTDQAVIGRAGMVGGVIGATDCRLTK